MGENNEKNEDFSSVKPSQTDYGNDVKNPRPLDRNTQRKILDAARDVFYRKGFSGARMQEIADEAGINKAMLHYYYRSKDNLFEAVFREAAMKLFPKIREMFDTEMPFLEKISYFIKNYISLLQENRHMPSFVLNELHHHPDRLRNLIINEAMISPEKIISDFRKAAEEGIIKPVDPRQVIINIIALCVFPFAARPLLQGLYGLNENEYEEFIERRKNEVPEFIINSIKMS